MNPELLERFLSRLVVESGGCWQWQGALTNGYGYFAHEGKSWRAHRAAYVWLRGPIPAGLQLDHLCRNRACVNPDHLEPVTRKENILRGVAPSATNSRKTHCPNGHPYNEDNTLVGKRGDRQCRICKRAWHRAWSKANKPYQAAYQRERRRKLRETA